jgi:hypothetical protein
MCSLHHARIRIQEKRESVSANHCARGDIDAQHHLVRVYFVRLEDAGLPVAREAVAQDVAEEQAGAEREASGLHVGVLGRFAAKGTDGESIFISAPCEKACVPVRHVQFKDGEAGRHQQCVEVLIPTEALALHHLAHNHREEDLR